MTTSTASRIINMADHTGWGNQIFWRDFEKGLLTGWMQNKPKKGDILRQEMQSGRFMLLRLTEVEEVRDPRDMFHGTAVELGYEDEVKL